MDKSQRALLKRCEIALTDWVLQYAPEQCERRHVISSSIRISALGGTLAYIGDLLYDIREELRK